MLLSLQAALGKPLLPNISFLGTGQEIRLQLAFLDLSSFPPK